MRVAAKKEEGHVRSELQPVLQIIFLRKQDNWNQRVRIQLLRHFGI
jgi:hypothetical protein